MNVVDLVGSTDPYSSDYSCSDDCDEEIHESQTDFEDTTAVTEHLGLTYAYQRSWGGREAFREFYQNWKDAIMKSFDLGLRDFRPEMTERGTVILVEVFRPGTRELLGYIRYRRNRKHDDDGILEITNFNATLSRHHLALGGTTKYNDSTQSGKFGEGFKLAANVLRRSPNNHAVVIESAGRRWNFVYDAHRKILCKITAIDKDKIAQWKHDARGQPRTCKAHVWEDVSITIGAPRKGRGSKGISEKCRKVPHQAIKHWLEATMDLVPPSRIVLTDLGDLILDPKYCNRLFLRGLELPNGSASGLDFKFGYNFLKGDTDRDRKTLGNTAKEASQLASIWAEVLRKEAQEKEAGEYLDTYTNMLLNSFEQYADISRVETCISKDTAKLVWRQMRHIYTVENGAEIFFYCVQDGKHEINLIKDCLKKNPIPVHDKLWKMLRKFKLCRTPSEEQQHRFKNARTIDQPDNNFARTMDWALKCCLCSDLVTCPIEIRWVDGQELGLDSLLEGTTWQIHGKWLSHEGVHGEQTFCEDAAASNDQTDAAFSCDHAVLELWENLITQLVAQDKTAALEKRESGLKNMARMRVLHMPRSVAVEETIGAEELRVSWTSMEPAKNNDKQVRITLHELDCAPVENAERLQYKSLFQAGQVDSCMCPSKISTVGSRSIVFTDLIVGTTYYAKVCRDYEGGFFGLADSTGSPLRPWVAKTLIQHSPVDDDDDDYDDDNDDEDQNNEVSNESGLVKVDRHESPPIRAVEPSSSRTVEPAGQESTHPSVGPATPAPESYTLGDLINHADLDWGGSFPGSHAFYHTRDDPNSNVFIAKPKPDRTKSNGKRAASVESQRNDGKRIKVEDL